MISPSRREELSSLFWNETNEEWTQEWRDDLTPEEATLVRQWDKRSAEGMASLCRRILELKEKES